MPPERTSGCPVCTWTGGFHDRQIHDVLVIEPKLFKEKDWQKNGQ